MIRSLNLKSSGTKVGKREDSKMEGVPSLFIQALPDKEGNVASVEMIY